MGGSEEHEDGRRKLEHVNILIIPPVDGFTNRNPLVFPLKGELGSGSDYGLRV